MNNAAPSNLWQAFCAVADRSPQQLALILPAESVDFASLQRRAQDYCRYFLGQGLQRQDRVLLSMQNSVEMLAALLGVWAAGGIAALLDVNCRDAQLQHALATVSPRFHLYLAGSLPEGSELADCSRCCDQIPRDVPPGDAAPVRALPTDPASIVFTSGSTGKPKGVVQTHGNILRGCATVAGYLGLNTGERLLCPVPWAFDYGYVQLHFTITLGVTQIALVQANPFSVCAAIAEHRPQVLAGTPSLYTYLLRGVSPIRQTDLTSLRTLTSSGGTIPQPVLQDLRQLLPDCRLFLNYGLTETYRTSYLDPALVGSRPRSIGKPIPGVDVAVLRSDGGQAAAGEIGEIVHRGDYICLGYWNDPEASARALRPDPLAAAGNPAPARALYTGDYGYLDDEGFLHFVGRRDHMLKSMGVRVSPAEVEALLHDSGLVREVAVFGVDHDMLGHEIWAAIAPLDGVERVEAQLQIYARQRMSPYMQPRRWMLKPALPKTATGKVDYPALKAEATALPSARLTREDAK